MSGLDRANPHSRWIFLGGALVVVTALISGCGSAPTTAGSATTLERQTTTTRRTVAVPSATEKSWVTCLKRAGAAFDISRGDGDSFSIVPRADATAAEEALLARKVEQCRPPDGHPQLDDAAEKRIATEHMRIVVTCMEAAGIKVEVRWDEGGGSADILTPGTDQSTAAYQSMLDKCTAKGLAFELAERERLGKGD